MDLSNSSLRRSIFYKADLKGSKLSGANLFKVNFTLANLPHLSSKDAIFSNAILCKTKMEDKVSDRNCNN